MSYARRTEIARNTKVLVVIFIVGLILIHAGAILINATDPHITDVTIDGEERSFLVIERPFIEHGWKLFFAGLFVIFTEIVFWAMYRKPNRIEQPQTSTPGEQSQKYCIKCGKGIVSNADFCPYCGSVQG